LSGVFIGSAPSSSRGDFKIAASKAGRSDQLAANAHFPHCSNGLVAEALVHL
jgi:hypothetical protein